MEKRRRAWIVPRLLPASVRLASRVFLLDAAMREIVAHDAPAADVCELAQFLNYPWRAAQRCHRGAHHQAARFQRDIIDMHVAHGGIRAHCLGGHGGR